MKRDENPDLLEFRGLMAAIREESELLKKLILSEEEEREASRILSEFGDGIQVQAISTLSNLAAYQCHGWRELVDDDSDDGTDSARTEG